MDTIVQKNEKIVNNKRQICYLKNSITHSNLQKQMVEFITVQNHFFSFENLNCLSLFFTEPA
ncbi:MAG: hypothetical protein A4S09_08225 [Proteobacteria bacterium SG_bin7]|nr:MAG: hypothetical protein A4S09_08225 [Proteobacteria bacterium SG_bin7]